MLDVEPCDIKKLCMRVGVYLYCLAVMNGDSIIVGWSFFLGNEKGKEMSYALHPLTSKMVSVSFFWK